MATAAAKKAPSKAKFAIDVAAIRRSVAQAFQKLKPKRKKGLGAPVDGERTLSTEIDTGVERNLVTRRIKTVMGSAVGKAKAGAKSQRLRKAAMAVAMVLPLFGMAGIAAWLFSSAEETERELEAAIPGSSSRCSPQTAAASSTTMRRRRRRPASIPPMTRCRWSRPRRPA